MKNKLLLIFLLLVSTLAFSQKVSYKNYAIEDINIMEQYVNDTLSGFSVEYNLLPVMISATNRNQWNLNQYEVFSCIGVFDRNVTVFNTYDNNNFELYITEFRLKPNEIDILLKLYNKIKL